MSISLPKYEAMFYYLYILTTISYGLYVIIQESSNYTERFQLWNWRGWQFRRDPSYLSWNLYLTFFFKNYNFLNLYGITIAQLVIKRFKFRQEYNRIITTLLSLSFMFYTFRTKAFLIPFSAMNLMYIITKTFRSKILIWSTTIVIMIVFNLPSYNRFVYLSFQEMSLDLSYYFIYKVAVYFLVLRLVSFCLDKIDYDKATTKYNYMSLFVYSFYPAFICNSSYIRFNDFYLSMIEERSIDWQAILKTIVRIALSFFLIELTLHTTLAYTIHNDVHLVDTLSKYTLAMSLLLKGTLFACTYNVFYGIPKICNELAGCKTTPLPTCVALIHTNSEMWKYFDTGMYEFIKHYLYIPMGGNRMSRIKHFLALAISFAYLSFWHGAELRVSLWSFANFFMVLVELLFIKFIIKNNETLDKDLCVPLLGCWQMCLHIFAFFFLSNIDITLAIYKKIFFEDFAIGLVIMTIGYFCNAQIRLNYKRFVV